MPYLPLHGPNPLQLKFFTIMQDFKRVWTLIASKRRIEQIIFFYWLSNVKNLVLSNGCEHVRNVIPWDLNSFFFQKLTKIAQRLGLCPQTPIATGVCGTFEYTSLLKTSPKLDICIFLRLVFALSLYQNPG